MLNNSWFHWNSKYFSCPKIFEIRAYAYIANFSLADATWHYSVMFVGLSNITQWEMMDKYTYVDAVLVRRVIIGLGNCNCELWIERFGELSGDDILLDQNWLISSLPGSFEHSIYWLAVFCRWSTLVTQIQLSYEIRGAEGESMDGKKMWKQSNRMKLTNKKQQWHKSTQQ